MEGTQQEGQRWLSLALPARLSLQRGRCRGTSCPGERCHRGAGSCAPDTTSQNPPASQTGDEERFPVGAEFCKPAGSVRVALGISWVWVFIQTAEPDAAPGARVCQGARACSLPAAGQVGAMLQLL